MRPSDPPPFNRLLDFRPLENLVRMDDAERATLLDEVLAQPPSKEAWLAICELVVSWPEGLAKSAGLLRAERALASWDDDLRFLWSSDGGLYDGGRLSSLARLAKVIEIYRRESRGSAELTAIATSDNARRLSRLRIVRSEVSSAAWQTLVNSVSLAELEQMHVQSVVLVRADVHGLLRSTHFPQLRSLAVENVGLRPDWLDPTADLQAFGRLHRVSLSESTLGDDGARAVSAADWLRRVEELHMRRSYLTGAGVRALIQSLSNSRMRRMDLTGNRIEASERSDLMRLAERSGLSMLL